jgi:hypothetical protein
MTPMTPMDHGTTDAAGGGMAHGGGATVGPGTYHGGGASSGGSGVWYAVQDLARIALALAIVLAFAFGISRAMRPASARAAVTSAVTVTSPGDVVPSAGGCDNDSVRLDVDNLPCRRHAGPR